MASTWLVRYGVIPEVARFQADEGAAWERHARVVVETQRGQELGTVLQQVPTPTARSSSNPPAGTEVVEAPEFSRIVRLAEPADVQLETELREECQVAYGEWWSRIRDWKLELELVDLEWTLDRRKLILYVLSGRGPETTRLALLAATAGYSSVEVQPVSKDGIQPLPAAGGGGGCGCGSGGCATH